MSVRVERDDSYRRINVTFPFDPADVAAVKRVSGARWVKKQKLWAVPLTVRTCKQLREQFGERLVIGSHLAKWAKENIALEETMWRASRAEDAELDMIDDELAEWLRPYQRAGIRFIAMSPAPLVADDMGLGKTAQVLLGIIESDLYIGEHLIVTPKTAVDTGVWSREIEKLWVPGDVFEVTGSRAKREKTIAAFEESTEETKWLIVNPAMVAFKRVKVLDDEGNPVIGDNGEPRVDLVPQFDALHREWTTVTVDECHKDGTRNPKTLTAQGLGALHVTGKRIAVSGTPMTNRPIDLWGTLHWLEPDIFSSKWAWADQWLEITDNGYGKEIGGIKPGEELEMFRSISPYLLRRRKTEVAKDLPEKNRIDVWCDMTPKQEKLYKAFAEDAMVKIAETEVSATNVLNELTRLKQFAAAYQDILGYDDNEKPMLDPDFNESGKAAHLEEIMVELGILEYDGRGRCVAVPYREDQEKIVIFSQFTQLVESIVLWLEARKVDTVSITGSVSGKRRKEAEERIQQGTAQAIVMNTMAGGTAITLDRASTVVFVDETWSPTDQEQGEDRCHRISRNHIVNVYKLRSKNTIEEKIMERVQGKDEVHKYILDHRRELELW